MRIGAFFVAALVAAAFTCAPSARPLADDAVARANYAGFSNKRHCTAFAIAPRVALTAAHCLRGRPATLTILFGYERMEWRDKTSAVGQHDLGADVALLCLDADAPAVLAVAEMRPERQEPLELRGYGRPRVHVQQNRECAVIDWLGTDILLNCAASPGFSGSPLLNTAGEAVAVMSRTGRATSIAASIPPIPDLCS